MNEVALVIVVIGLVIAISQMGRPDGKTDDERAEDRRWLDAAKRRE